MKSIEIIVPRKLIKEFYPHPESYGDYVVTLVNGMYTDVYYREEGYFITITSEEDLIHYLENQEVTTVKYIFRNGVFAFRQIESNDDDLLVSWNKKESRSLTGTIQLEDSEIKKFKDLPQSMMLAFYWIEVGLMKLHLKGNVLNVDLNIYESSRIIDNDDIEIFLLVIKEYLMS